MLGKFCLQLKLHVECKLLLWRAHASFVVNMAKHG